MARHRGRGFATIEYPTGMNQNGDPSQAWIKLKPDGRVVPIPPLLTPEILDSAQLTAVEANAHAITQGLSRLTAWLMGAQGAEAEHVTHTEIADRLNLSVKTVSTHKTRILQKMSASSVADLVRYAIRHHLTDEPPAKA